MKIIEISINNFKAFKDITYFCNENFNIIIGENNIGKSTIIEALQLWKKSYDILVTENSKKFYSIKTNRYLSFSELSFLRVKNDDDMFNCSKTKRLTISLKIKCGEDIYTLPITLEKTGIKNSYFRVLYSEEETGFNEFSENMRGKNIPLKEAILIYQTRPIAHIIRNEPFYNNAQLLKKISSFDSHKAIRNKILKSENKDEAVDKRFENLENILKNIFGKDYFLRFKNRNRQDEEFIRLTVREKSKKEIDISLMGSGFLQVIEIFSTLAFVNHNSNCLKVILIDEPDSHLHSEIQSRLIDELKKHCNYQQFIISHNDRLIKKSVKEELFYLSPNCLSKNELSHFPLDDYTSIQFEMGKWIFDYEKENNNPILITEGKTDRKIIINAWNKLYPTEEFPFTIISSGLSISEDARSGNAETVRRTLEFISTIMEDIVVIGIFDNDREGNEQFKGLNKTIFEAHSLSCNYRKHKEKQFYGMLLPIPEFRNFFVTTNSLTQRYFVIEHYFENSILESKNMKGENILETEIFEIKGNKTSFSEDVSNLTQTDFKHFSILFDKIKELIENE